MIKWWDNQLYSVKSRQKFLWKMTTQHIKTFYCSNMRNELKGFLKQIKWATFAWMQDFWVLLKLDSISWLKTLENNFMQWLVVNTLFQEMIGSSQPRGWIQGNIKIGPVLEVTTGGLRGKYGVEIRIWSLSEDNTHSWVSISHGSNKFVMDSNNNDTEVPEYQPEEQALQLNVKDFAARSKAKAKPQRTEPAEFSSRIVPMNRRKLDSYWTRESLSLCVRSFEESNPSSSSLSTSTSRRGWSGSFLENRRKSSESIPAVYSLVWRSMESMLDSRRRSKKEISVLHWWFRNNCLFPSSSRTFRTQSYWSFIAGQCCDSERIFPSYLSQCMCV